MKSKRIVVIGVSAAGKTTFAERLAKKILLPLFKMDAIMWQPGWKYVGDERAVAEIITISNKEEWIIEGYISSAIRADLFEKADLILYLDYPGWLSAWRYIVRWWKHRREPRPELPGSPEVFSFTFLKLVYTKGETKKLERLFSENNWGEKIVRFKHPREAEAYLKEI